MFNNSKSTAAAYRFRPRIVRKPASVPDTVSGLRKQFGERDEGVMAIKFVSEISIAYGIVRKPGQAGHLCDPPTGPEM